MSPESPFFIRLYLDEDVQKRVASAFRLRHFDVATAHEVRRWGLSDEEQLTYTATEGQALFPLSPCVPLSGPSRTVFIDVAHTLNSCYNINISMHITQPQVA